MEIDYFVVCVARCGFCYFERSINMFKKMKKYIATILVFALYISLISTIPAFASPVYGYNGNKFVRKIDLIGITEKYVYVSDGAFYITDKDSLRRELQKNWSYIKKEVGENTTVEDVILALENRFAELNEMSNKGDIRVSKNGQIYDTSLARASAYSHYTQQYWWGVRHTFYSDDAARDYAHELRMVAHLNAGAAAIAGVVFTGVGALPSGLSAIYAYSVADTVDYNANKPGKGVILEIKWILAYKCYPRR